MPSDTFRLESFRPWDPFQDKSQPPRESLDVCHYPSPVSITATSTSSNSRDSPSRCPNVHSHTSGRHPLPPRPPVEVCLNESLPPEINTQHQPTVENQTSYIDLGVEALDFEDILHLQDLPSAGDEAHPPICDSLGQDSQYPLFESSDLGIARTASQHSHVSHAESSVLTRECCDTMIDPAILTDYPLRDIEQTPASKETSDVVAPSHSPDKTVRGRSHSIRPRSQRAMKPGRQRSKINKVSVVVNNRRMENTGQSTRAKRPVKMSFSTLRDQFSSLPIEERLQFLSWLFEGALSQCLHIPSRSNDISKSNDTSKEEGVTTSSAEQSSGEAKVAHRKHTCSSRKGLPWLAEENRLLVQLREEESLAWSEVFKRFDQSFPGRSLGSIQVYWSTSLKKQLAS